MNNTTDNEPCYDSFIAKSYENFIATFDSENSKKVARSLKQIGEYDYANCTPIDIQNIILSMKPNSPKAITTIAYMLSLYAKYLDNDDMYHIARDIDRNVLWAMAKPIAKKKFISHYTFENVYKEVGVYEEYNSFYLQTLFRAIYEGIYCDDMSVLKNLRGSDIDTGDATYDKLPDGKFSEYESTRSILGVRKNDYDSEHESVRSSLDMRQHSCRFLDFQNENKKTLDGKFFDFQNEEYAQQHLCKLPDGKFLENENIKPLFHFNNVTLREDNGNEYKLSISNRLAEDLKKLAEINIWERKNRFGTCKVKITGLHDDSCFKVEKRKDSSEYSYRYTYYRMLRKISKEYLEYNLLPLQLYVSGIMHRIEKKLKEHDIGLEEAFSNNNKNRMVNKIILEELKRCNCDTEVKNFREMVIGHLDVFLT